MAKVEVTIYDDASVSLFVQAARETMTSPASAIGSALAARMMDALRQVLNASGFRQSRLCEGDPTNGMHESYVPDDDAFLKLGSPESKAMRTAIAFLLSGETDKAKRWLLQWVDTGRPPGLPFN
jgi:hypothetical protein